MPDLLDEMARAAFAVHAAENADMTWEELDHDAQALFRRSVAAALKVALTPMSNPDYRLEGIHPGPEFDELQSCGRRMKTDPFAD